EAAGELAGDVLVILAADAEYFFRVLFGRDEDIAILHKVGHPAAGLGLTPEFGAVVEVDAYLHGSGAGRLQRLARRLCGGRAESWRNAGDVEPLRAVEDHRPVHGAGTDVRDRGAFAVIENAAGPRGRAEFQEVNADAVLVSPNHVLGADA